MTGSQGLQSHEMQGTRTGRAHVDGERGAEDVQIDGHVLYNPNLGEAPSRPTIAMMLGSAMDVGMLDTIMPLLVHRSD